MRYHKWFKDTNWRLLLDKRATTNYKLPSMYQFFMKEEINHNRNSDSEITDKKPECFDDCRDSRPVDPLKDPFLDW